MIYIGIDIAKLNHFVSTISSDGKIWLQPFKFTNDYDGFHLLFRKLDSLDPDSIIIGLESTAHYGNNLVEFLLNNNYKVCVINPIQTSAIRKNNIRKTKTDKADTYIITKTLMMNPHYFITRYDIDLLYLKELGCFHMKLIKKCTKAKIQLTSYLNQAFPDLQYFFKSDIHYKGYYMLLKEAYTLELIVSIQDVIMKSLPISFPRLIFLLAPSIPNLLRTLITILFVKSNQTKLMLLRLHVMHLTSGRISNNIVLWMNYAINLKP